MSSADRSSAMWEPPGSHLHYEVIKGGQRVNPVYYFYSDITPEEYNAILESSRKVNQSLS